MAGGLEDIEGAGDVDLVGAHGVFDGAGDARPGGGVEDAVGAAGSFVDGVRVGDGGLDEGGGGVGTVALAGGEVVEGDDVVAELNEPVYEAGADEAAAAGDKVSHGVCPRGGIVREGHEWIGDAVSVRGEYVTILKVWGSGKRVSVPFCSEPFRLY